MATVSLTREVLKTAPSGVIQAGNALSSDDASYAELFTWTGLTTTNQDGQPLQLGQNVTSVIWQVTGTDGTGGELKVEHSNDATNFDDLDDSEGNAITGLTAGEARSMLFIPRVVRPINTAGNGSTSHTVTAYVTYR